MKTFQPKKVYIFLFFYFFAQHICNAQAPIDLLKKEKYHPIQYNSKLLNSNIKFKNNTLINILLSENKISERVYGNTNKNTIFISSLICFKIKKKNILFEQSLKSFDDDDIDLLIVNILKENIKHEDFLNLKKCNSLGFFLYFNYNNNEMGYEIVELKGKKELLIKKEKINYLTLEKID
jgi:hypothetical protein